jgi:hypothetical protein
MLHVQVVCPCCISVLHVHASCFRSAYLCYYAVLHTHAACPSFMSMLHVHASCPCFMSMLHVHASCPCFMSMLHVQVSMLPVLVADVRKFNFEGPHYRNIFSLHFRNRFVCLQYCGSANYSVSADYSGSADYSCLHAQLK